MFKKFFEQIRKQVMYFLAERFYLKGPRTSLPFTDFVKDSFNFLVIMPENQKDFNCALEFVNFLIFKKNITLLLKEEWVSLLGGKKGIKCIGFGKDHLNRVNLPSKAIKDILADKKFDVVIDLNLLDNIFCSVMANLVISRFRIGFKKKNSENFYNLILVNNEINAANSYRNLLNSLQMF